MATDSVAAKSLHDHAAAPARTAHHDHLMRREIAEPQPPIALLLIRLHENKIQTYSPLVHPFVTRTSRMSCSSCVWPFPGAGERAVKGRAAPPARAHSASALDGASDARATLQPRT